MQRFLAAHLHACGRDNPPPQCSFISFRLSVFKNFGGLVACVLTVNCFPVSSRVMLLPRGRSRVCPKMMGRTKGTPRTKDSHISTPSTTLPSLTATAQAHEICLAGLHSQFLMCTCVKSDCQLSVRFFLCHNAEGDQHSMLHETCMTKSVASFRMNISLGWIHLSRTLCSSSTRVCLFCK